MWYRYCPNCQDTKVLSAYGRNVSLTSSCPQLSMTFSSPQWGAYTPYFVLYTASVLSGLPANVSGRTILSEKAQPTTKVS
jgi:hypothetical protein